MDRSWARDYAERWGLPHPALNELVGALREHQRHHDDSSRAPTEGARGMEPLRRQEKELGTDPYARATPGSSDDDPAWAGTADFGSRYEEMGVIGEGGMGEVRRMWDLSLNRSVAMKILRKDLSDREDLVLRFVEEAQATAQLEHPGIVPVYEIGRLPDRRPYFTMKEIRGRSLLDVIEEVHAASSDGHWGTTPTGWTFHRLIGVFNQVCEAIAYAHARGVLHRDLKPTNVMVGGFGEVVVMDWGLAKIAGAAVTSLTGGGNVVTDRSRGGLYQTRSGSVAGTPNYMPPEQARGDHARIGPWSDVYSLGALLYEILADRAPYEGDELDSVVQAVLTGPPPPPIPRWQLHHAGGGSARRKEEHPPEEGLRTICARAMARDIAERFMDASTLRDAVAGWLERAGARENAVNLVKSADALAPEIQSLRTKVHQLRADADKRLSALPREATLEEKRTVWSIEDQAREYERQLERKESEYAEMLKAALVAVPNLPEAVNRLEATRDPNAATGGEGELRLATEPPATAHLLRVQPVDRRLVPVATKAAPSPVPTPIDGETLAAGTWQIELHAEGHMPLRLLAQILPGKVWSTGPTPMGKPVRLARAGEDPPDAVRIPQGFFLCGGDRESADALPSSRVWVGAYLITRFPITVAQFLVFLDSVHDAELLAPPDFLRDTSGRFTGPPGWRLEEPMRRVSFEAASAYADWITARTGRYWRLPREFEWEKAARGVDGRTYPWGDFLDPTWCAVYDGQAEPRPAPVDAFPLDVSPYGVRGMAGNVRDWVVDERSPRRSHGGGGLPSPEHRYVKGGHYLGVAQFARCALRYRLPAPFDDTVGFRLVSPLDGA